MSSNQEINQMTTQARHSPELIPTRIWREFVLNHSIPLLTDFDWFDEAYPAGHIIFNGGIYDYDNDVFDVEMRKLYRDKFIPFLEEIGVNVVDMYIYMRQEYEMEEFYPDVLDTRIKRKEIVMAMWGMKVLNGYQDDFQEFDAILCYAKGWITLQALFRGHNARWKNPFFTFKD